MDISICLNYLKQINHYFNLTEKAITIFLLFCFIFPLTLPNWVNFGVYKQIDLNLQTSKCDFLEISKTSGNGDYIVGENNVSKITNFGSIQLKHGGKYINNHCNTSQHVAIIVPYRNRSEHLHIFLQQIHPFLMKQNAIHYQIFVIEQVDDSPFNRGNLLNIGVVESLRIDSELNCFIFHDVDILPLDVRQLYTCSSTPRHLCSYLDKFRYVLIYPNLFGGVIAIKREQFVRINGYSNLYRGWGGEDDDFYLRVRQRYGQIERYRKDVGRCVMLSHHQNEEINHDRSYLLNDPLKRSQNDGLTSIAPTYERKQIDYAKLYVKIKVFLKY